MSKKKLSYIQNTCAPHEDAPKPKKRNIRAWLFKTLFKGLELLLVILKIIQIFLNFFQK